MVKAKITRVMVSVVELPAHIVEAYTADGKPIEPAKLADMLAKERTVLIAMDGKKVDPFQLQLYKEDTIVLVPPPNLECLEYGPYNLSFDAPLSIDGKKTASTGKRRVFTTPPLRLRQTFTYEFQAFWPSGRTSTFRVNVQAQEATNVDVAEPKE